MPHLVIEDDDYIYTMIHVKDERVSGYDEEERQRQIDKLYNEVITPYHYKRCLDMGLLHEFYNDSAINFC